MYKGEKKWVSKEGKHNVVVERSVEGEEREAIRRQQPFDPFVVFVR